MKRPFVKVCGMTRKEDVRAVAKTGVDALGFILYPQSPRGLQREEAVRLAGEAVGVTRVLVTVDQSANDVNETLHEGSFEASQLHGQESPDVCAQIKAPVVKAIRTSPDLKELALRPYKPYPLLLDGYSSDRPGGTGLVSNWTLARELVLAGYRVILAGGLGPQNLEEALAAVQPLAVDLNSAVESRPGIKDLALLQTCIDIVHRMTPRNAEENPWQV